MQGLTEPERAEPLTVALRKIPANPLWAQRIVAFGAITATTAVLLVYQMGQPRIFFSMARDGLLPAVFAKVHPIYKTPHVTTIGTGLVVGLVASIANIDEMVNLTNIGTLFAFILVCVGIPVLRYKDPDRARPFRVPLGPFLLPGLGVLSCLSLIVYLPQASWWRFAGWLVLGMAVYASYGYAHSLVGRDQDRPDRTPLGLKVAGIAFLVAAVGMFVIPHETALSAELRDVFQVGARGHQRAVWGLGLILTGACRRARRDRERPAGRGRAASRREGVVSVDQHFGQQDHDDRDLQDRPDGKVAELVQLLGHRRVGVLDGFRPVVDRLAPLVQVELFDQGAEGLDRTGRWRGTGRGRSAVLEVRQVDHQGADLAGAAEEPLAVPEAGGDRDRCVGNIPLGLDRQAVELAVEIPEPPVEARGQHHGLGHGGPGGAGRNNLRGHRPDGEHQLPVRPLDPHRLRRATEPAGSRGGLRQGIDRSVLARRDDPDELRSRGCGVAPIGSGREPEAHRRRPPRGRPGRRPADGTIAGRAPPPPERPFGGRAGQVDDLDRRRGRGPPVGGGFEDELRAIHRASSAGDAPWSAGLVLIVRRRRAKGSVCGLGHDGAGRRPRQAEERRVRLPCLEAQAQGPRTPKRHLAAVGTRPQFPERGNRASMAARALEPVASEQVRPLIEALQAAYSMEQVVFRDDFARHVRDDRAEDDAALRNAVQLAQGAGEVLLGEVGEGRVMDEVERIVVEREVAHVAEQVLPLPRLGRLRVDERVALDAPGVHPELGEIAQGLARGRARIEQLVGGRSPPCKANLLDDEAGVERLAIRFLVARFAHVVVEVIVVEDGAGDVERLDDHVRDEVGRVEDAVDRGVEQVIADEVEAGVPGRLRDLPLLQPLDDVPARPRADRPEPAMDVPFEEMLAGGPHLGGQGVERLLDQLGVAEFAGGNGVAAGEQPGEDAERADVVPRALVVNAAAAEGVDHEERFVDRLAPERLAEEERNPQVVGGVVVVREVRLDRALEHVAAPIEAGQPGRRQRDGHGVELLGARLALAAVGDLIRIADCALFDPVDGRFKLDPRGDGVAEGVDQPLHAALDRVELAVLGIVDEVVVDPVKRVHPLGLGREVAVHQDLQVAPRGLVGDLVEDRLERATEPGVIVVGGPRSVVKVAVLADRVGQRVEVLDRLRRCLAEVEDQVGMGAEDMAVEDDGAALHADDGQAEDLLDEEPQGVLAVLVELRRAGLVGDGRVVEELGHDLATEPGRGLEDGDVERLGAALPEEKRREEAPGPSADDGDPSHDLPFILKISLPGAKESMVLAAGDPSRSRGASPSNASRNLGDPHQALRSTPGDGPANQRRTRRKPQKAERFIGGRRRFSIRKARTQSEPMHPSHPYRMKPRRPPQVPLESRPALQDVTVRAPIDPTRAIRR